MITADKIQSLTTLSKNHLVQILNRSGYSGTSFKSANFLGLTNGGEFCYRVVYFDDAGTGEEVGKVFVKYDNSTDSITADF